MLRHQSFSIHLGDMVMEVHTIVSGLTGAFGVAVIQGIVKIAQVRTRRASEGDEWARSMVESMIAQERQRGAEERAECGRRLDVLEARVHECHEERSELDLRLRYLQEQHNELREILDSITPAADSEPPPRGGIL